MFTHREGPAGRTHSPAKAGECMCYVLMAGTANSCSFITNLITSLYFPRALSCDGNVSFQVCKRYVGSAHRRSGFGDTCKISKKIPNFLFSFSLLLFLFFFLLTSSFFRSVTFGGGSTELGHPNCKSTAAFRKCTINTNATVTKSHHHQAAT